MAEIKYYDDDQNYKRDIRWFHRELKKYDLPAVQEGESSAFAERVAILLEGRDDFELELWARKEALNEYIRRVGKCKSY